MADHILNRSLPPADPRPVEQQPTPEQIKLREGLKRIKAAEAVARAISRSRT